ncbi:MAG: 2-amino-4-hydroxy-6-hydroxymethyldihydropteridine diphosphokinase [Candidatus Thiodiazotropha sp.]
MTEPGAVRVWLSLGSNIEPRSHIPRALKELDDEFGKLIISPVYESEAVGFRGDNFLNLVVGLRTTLGPQALMKRLREIEALHGRKRDAKGFNSRTLDIDLLTYADQIIDSETLKLPRGEILKYAFVLLPLANVAGNERHPVAGKTYQELWDSFDSALQHLWPVELSDPSD